MAAVTFYRFAAAMMELLEPDKYNFTRNAVDSVRESIANLQPENINVGEGRIQCEGTEGNLVEDKTMLLPGEEFVNHLSELQTTPESVKIAEAKAVDAVADHLTKAIANASDEKLAQVAEMIMEASVETAIPMAQSVEVCTNVAQSKTIEKSTDVTTIVEAAVKALAEKTTEEIKQPENTEILISSNIVPADSRIEATATETIINSITEKIEEKLTETVSTESFCPSLAQSPASEVIKTSEVYNLSFWEQFPELDPSEIKDYDVLRGYYDFMKEAKALDIFNPAIELEQRYSGVSGWMGLSNQRYAHDANLLHETERNLSSFNNQIKTLTEKPEADEEETRAALDLKLQQDRKMLEERISAERLKHLR